MATSPLDDLKYLENLSGFVRKNRYPIILITLAATTCLSPCSSKKQEPQQNYPQMHEELFEELRQISSNPPEIPVTTLSHLLSESAKRLGRALFK